MKLYGFMTHPDLCGSEFTGESWAVHREVIARLWDGDSDRIPREYHSVALKLLGTDHLPSPGDKVDELYLAFGRGGGKTRFAAVAATHAWAENYRDCGLAAGACATIPCASPSVRQAREWLNYCHGLIEQSPVLSAMVHKRTSETIGLNVLSTP